MSDLRDLYQEVIIDHSRRPRNFGVLAAPTHNARGHNPLCGDQLTLQLELDGDRIARIGFQGQGCAISTASASVMTETVLGKTLKEVDELYHRFHDLVTADPTTPRDTEGLGKLQVFAGVCEFPARVKCASLAWHTLQAALSRRAEPVTTE
jgi:nitrogen fixation NifU-like protein